MSQTQNDNTNGASAGAASGSNVGLGVKLGYIGTGVLIGLIIYPFVRKTLGKVQPTVDALFDDLTGKAEDLAERASDFVAKARARVIDEKESPAHAHDHSHDHSHEGHNH